jgi:hypothetical protein
LTPRPLAINVSVIAISDIALIFTHLFFKLINTKFERAKKGELADQTKLTLPKRALNPKHVGLFTLAVLLLVLGGVALYKGSDDGCNSIPGRVGLCGWRILGSQVKRAKSDRFNWDNRSTSGL